MVRWSTQVPISPVRFAVIGDVEPKPDPVFDNFERCVRAINRLHSAGGAAFTAGIGDLVHAGKMEQYEVATRILRTLKTPFYPIVGNEELCEGAERFLSFAREWNADPGEIPGVSYTKEVGGVRFIFASAMDRGKTFTEAEVEWIMREVEREPARPVIVFTHAPMAGVFPDAGERTMKNALLDRVVAHERVRAVFSGHVHMDLDSTTTYVCDAHGVHHIHVPGVERTKVGARHTPRFRWVTIDSGGGVLVRTYNVLEEAFEPGHEIRFSL